MSCDFHLVTPNDKSCSSCRTGIFILSSFIPRNRAKSIVMVFPPAFTLRLFYVHVDNTRDVSNKTTYMTFFAGTSAEELVKLQSSEVEARFVGWVKFHLKKPDGINVVKIEFKGPDNRCVSY